MSTCKARREVTLHSVPELRRDKDDAALYLLTVDGKGKLFGSSFIPSTLGAYPAQLPICTASNRLDPRSSNYMSPGSPQSSTQR